MSRKVFSLVLALALVISLAPCVFASSDEAYQSAYTLYQNGLFKGTGTYADGTPDFDLDRTPTRHEAVTMLVRLLGKEGEALANTWTTPFTDVADWAAPYVGYAYANGLTNGTSATTFGGTTPVDAQQYLTFVLRALGYVSGVDFQWETATQYAIGWLGLSQDLVDAPFTRGDVAVISCWALDSFPKDGNEKLGETLFGKFGYAPATIPTDDPLMKIYYTDRAPALDVVGRYDDGNEYAVHLTLAPLAPVTAMLIVSLDDPYYPDSSFSVGYILQEIGDVDPGQAVEVGISIPEFCSHIAVAYADQNGSSHVFNLLESGYDGSIGASEYGIDPGWYLVYVATPNVQCPKCGYEDFITGVGTKGIFCSQCGCYYCYCSDCNVAYPMRELIDFRCKNCRGPSVSIVSSESAGPFSPFLNEEVQAELGIERDFYNDLDYIGQDQHQYSHLYGPDWVSIGSLTRLVASSDIFDEQTRAPKMSYALLKTKDGREMLVVRSQNFLPGDDFTGYFVFCEDNGQFHLTYAEDSWSRSSTELHEGLVFSGVGSSGAGDSSLWCGYINEGGYYQKVYTERALDGLWVAMYASEVFGSDEQWAEDCTCTIVTTDAGDFYDLDVGADTDLDKVTLLRQYLESQGMNEVSDAKEIIDAAKAAHGISETPVITDWTPLPIY